MGKSSSMWALLLLVPCVLAGPILQNSCSTECRSPLNPKFRYAIGQTYTYDFQANSKTWMMGTSDDQAELQVKGQALVTFRSACDAVLQLKQASITGLDEKVDASELQKRPLSFTWQDGTVESLCPEREDPAWVVNIKRSVLSMLQHTAQFVDVPESHVIESDVIGRCPTEYAIESAGKSIKVTKTKIPNQCSHRIDRQSSIPTVAYMVPAETQTIPLMNSTSICQLQIKDNVIQATECRETHLFRPLSSENGGARTEVTSSISLISTLSSSAQVKPSNDRVPSTLILDPRGVQLEFQDAKDVNTVVRAICQHLAGESPARVSHLFNELVHSLRKASPKEVKAAYNGLRGKKICPESTKTEKLFLDALPQAGSTGTISLMVDILKENKLSSRQTLSWYLSLPLAKFADLDAIKAVLPLVESASSSPVALLGLTGLARRYCNNNWEQCQASAEVQQFSTKLSKMLGNKCKVDAKDEVKVMSALKALGNLGVMTPEVRATVAECVKDASLPATVRLAAIEATRNTPCDKQVKENLLTILEDRKEDAEIRIAAYQGVMRCPCSPSMLRIQNLLNTEETNQVGSYISSHLNNIKSNPTPGKENTRRLVKKLSLERSFPNDLRKYSRNLAVTDFCAINNAGWDVDANIVYAPKSFIPRSASMNLTLDLFGQSVNLFEFGVRAENLERILEAYLGPDGVVEKQGVAGLLEKASDSIEKFGENVWNRVASITRSKRASIKTNELTNLDKLVNMKDKPAGIKLDAFLRVFGAEIGMVNYRGASSGQPKLELMEGLQSRIAEAWRDLIEGAKRVEIDVARSMMFLDTSATFPTVAGFPLRLAVNGTTTVGLGLESQMDLPALLRDPLNANIKMKVNPLAVTELSASMTVDIAIAKTGIKMAATIHSSMAADFSARLIQGTTVDVKLDLPKSKMTLIDFKSDVMLIQQSADNTEKNKPMKINNEATYTRGGCSERLSAVTGMRLCATSSVSIPRPLSDSAKDPAPAFPLSGSTAFSVVLEKTEPSMKGYILSATTTQEDPKSKTFLMTFDTPGSRTNRKISIKGLLSLAPTMTIKVDTKAPWGSLAVEAEMVDRPEVKSVLMKVTTQEKREYYGKVQVNVVRGDRQYTLATTVEAGWPQQPRAVILEGGFGHEIGRSVELSLKPAGPYAKLPYNFQVTIGREFSATVQKIWLNNFQLVTPLGSALLSTEIGRQERNYVAALNMKYGTEHKMNAVSFNGHVQSVPQAGDKAVSYKTVVQYKSSRFPNMNIDLKWDLQAAPKMLSNILVLVHGPEIEHSTNRLYINKYIQVKGHYSTKDFAFDNKLEVTYPRYALNLKVDQAIKIDDRLVKAAMTLHMDNMKLFDTDLALVISPKDPKNIYELAAKMTYPGRTISLVDTGKRIDRNSFSMSPVLDIQPGRKIELNGKASLIRDQNGMSMNLDSEMRVSGFNTPIKVRHSFQYTGDMTVTTTNKIEWAGQPQLVLDGKVFLRTRSMPAIEMVFIWSDRLEAKMDARLSKDESKMDLDLNMMRLQRRVKINSQHKFLGDTRSGSINVAWDADKDSTKQVGFEGTFTLSKAQRLMDLKTTLNIESRLYSLALVGKLGAEYLNGDHTVRMEVQLPLMKKMMWNMVMSNIYQAKTITNRLEVETQMSTGGTYQISFNNNVNDLDRNLYTYNANTDLTIKGTSMEDIKMRLDSKRTVRADKRNVDFKGLLIAPKWGQNIDSSLNVEVSKDSVRFSSKYQRGSMLVTIESAGKKARLSPTELNLEGSFEVKAPKTSWQQMKFAMAATYDLKSITNFEMNERVTIEYQSSKVITGESKIKVSPTTVDISTMLETPYQVARRQSLNLNARFDPTNPRNEGSLVVMWSSPSQRQPLEARVEVEMERRPSQLRFKLTTSTPIKGMESSELSFDVRSLEDSKVREIDLVVGISEKKATLNGRFNLNPSQREVDLTLNLPSYNPLRFLARVGSQASTYTLETRIDWGTGTFTVEGNTKWISSDNCEIQMKIHSPELGVNNYEVKGVNKLQNKQRTMELTVMRKSSSILILKSVYDRKEDRTATQISGTAQMSAPEAQFTGTIKYMAERRMVDSSDEKGSLYKFEVDMAADGLVLNKASGHLKMTNKDQSASLVACTSTNTCQEASFAYKDAGIKPAVGKEAHLLLKTKENGVQEIRGLRVKHVSSTNKFEHTAEILFDEAKNRLIGYKVYRKDDEFGMEVYTPKRVSGAALEMVRGSGRQAAKAQYILTVWLDKTKAPERKLVIVTTVEPHKIGEMEGLTTSTTIKHPILPKDLEYKVEFHVGKRGRDMFHVKIDADVLDAKHQRWTLETHVKNLLAETNGRNITVDMELRSKGADVAALLSLYGGSNAEHLYSAGANLKLKEKERIEKELFVRMDVAPQSASMTFGSPAKQTTFEGRWNVDKIVSYHRLQLSASTRIFGLSPTVYVLDMNTSPHVDIRVFTKGASENYHQVVGGLLDDNRFELALIRQLNVQRKELAAVYVSLNSSELLTTRLTWKIEDLRALLTTVRARSQAVANELKSIRSSLGSDLSAIVLKWRSFGNLKSTYEKLAADYAKQLKQLKSETEQDESMKEAAELMENISWGIKYLGELIENVVGEWENKGDLSDRIEKFFEDLSDRVTMYMRATSNALTQCWNDIIRYLEQWKLQYGQKDGIVAAIRNFYQAKSQEIKEFVAKFSSSVDERFRKVLSWVESLKIGERNVIVALKEAISNANMDLLRERIANFLDETVLLPYEEFLTELAKAYPETTRSVYRYGKVPVRKIRVYLRRSSQITRNMTHVAETTVSDKGSLLASWLGEVVVYDVKNGEIRYRLPLSRKVSSLRDLWKIFDMQTSQMRSLAVTSSLRDMYREVRAKYAPTLAYARLNGHASLIGSKGLITFDKKSFDLTGASCQYLLARDFLNMEFAIAVNFEQSSGGRIKKSIIFTGGADQIEIKDEQVFINNKPASLPVNLENIQFQRYEEEGIVTVWTTGASLRCDIRKDICTFEISPFYTGRTMGLWGTFTNEQADDMTEPNGKISKDMTSFVNSWKINKTCKDNVQTVTESPRLIEAAVNTDRCDNLFAEKDSDLSSCFKVVSPAPYHDLCLKFAYKAKTSEPAFQSQLESLIAGYRATCQRWEVSL